MKPKTTIPASLQDFYYEVTIKAIELRRENKTHLEVCEELNRLGYRARMGRMWRQPQQIIRLLRSFGGEG